MSNLLLFLLGFAAARLLAPTAFGQYGTAFAYVGLFRLLPDFGMSYASTLAISRDRSLAQRLLGGLLGFQAVLSLLTLALALGIGAARYEGVTWTAVWILSFDLVLKAVKSTLRWVLKGLERFGTEAASLVAERTLILVLGTAALLSGQGVVGFVAAFAAVRLLDSALLAAYVHARVVRVRPHYDRTLWWDLFRRGLPYAYAGAMITLFFQLDAVMLEAMKGPEAVGYYRAPVLVLEGLTLVPRILGYALIPTMAAVYATRPEVVTALYARATKYLVAVGLPVAAFALLASDRFIPLVFGPEYAKSVPLARILLPAAVLMFVSNFGETTLACIDRWRPIVVVSTACLALNVALNLWWIPLHGARGAAWATLLTEGSYLAATVVALRRYGHPLPLVRLAARPLLATAAFSAALVATGGLPLVLSAAVASAVYAGATVALGTWDAKERALARELLMGRAPDAQALA